MFNPPIFIVSSDFNDSKYLSLRISFVTLHGMTPFDNNLLKHLPNLSSDVIM